jgi:hypothetical protein
VGTVLDVAAVALALVVTGSLALLAWTLSVSAVHRIRRGRRVVAEARAQLARAEPQLNELAATARDQLRDLAERTKLDRRKGT